MPDSGYGGTVIAAWISIPMSLTIVLTVLFFPSMLWNKIFMEIILCISMCDIMGNWPYALGAFYYPSNGTAVCKFEGFCNIFFFPASWMYTTMLTYLLKSLLVHGLKPVQLARWKIHSICLGIPLLFALLVLVTNKYGISSQETEKVCTYTGNLSIGNEEHAVLYNGLLLANFAIMIYFLIQLYWLAKRYPPIARSQAFVIVLRALCFYPIALFVCWFPHVILELINYSYTDPTQADSVIPAFDCVKIMHGGVTTLIFFFHSGEARNRWVNLLCICRRIACCRSSRLKELLPSSTPMTESNELDLNDSFRASTVLGEALISDTSANKLFTPNKGFRGSDKHSFDASFTSDKIAQSLLATDGSVSVAVSVSPPPTASAESRGNASSSQQTSATNSETNSRVPSVNHSISRDRLADWPQDSVLIQLFAQIAAANNVQSSSLFGVLTNTPTSSVPSSLGPSVHGSRNPSANATSPATASVVSSLARFFRSNTVTTATDSDSRTRASLTTDSSHDLERRLTETEMVTTTR